MLIGLLIRVVELRSILGYARHSYAFVEIPLPDNTYSISSESIESFSFSSIKENDAYLTSPVLSYQRIEIWAWKIGVSINIKQIFPIGIVMKEEECIEKVTITVFPPMEGIGIIESDPPIIEDEDVCGDPMDAAEMSIAADADVVVMKLNDDNPMVKISQVLEKAQMKYGENICIRTANYSTKESLSDAVEWLNAALRGSGNNTVLTEASFASFIGTSAPIITLNNRLSFVGIVPNESQLLLRIGATMRVLEEGAR